MIHRLIVYLGGGGLVRWLSQNANGRVLSGPLAVERLPDGRWPDAQETVVLVAIPELSVRWLDVPKRGRETWRRAVRFALEDQLASEVQELHFALPDRLDVERVAVAYITRDAMQRIRQRCVELELDPQRIVPAALLLPEGAEPAIAFDGQLLLWRDDERSAGSFEASLLPTLLSDTPRVRWLIPPNAQPPRLPGIELIGLSTDDPLRVLVSAIDKTSLPNLLQGEFAPAAKVAADRRAWRAVAIAASFAFALALGERVYSLWQLHALESELSADKEAVFRKVLGPDARLVNAPVQLQSELDRLQSALSGNGALDLIAQIAPVLATELRVALKSVDYRDGTLELGLGTPDVNSFDRLRERLETLPGLRIEVAGTSYDEGGFTGRLRLQGGGS